MPAGGREAQRHVGECRAQRGHADSEAYPKEYAAVAGCGVESGESMALYVRDDAARSLGAALEDGLGAGSFPPASSTSSINCWVERFGSPSPCTPK